MKKGALAAVISAAVLVIAICVLIITGVIKINIGGSSGDDKPAAAYIEFMESFMIINEDGLVTGSSLQRPESIPKISGLSYDSIIVGKDGPG